MGSTTQHSEVLPGGGGLTLWDGSLVLFPKGWEEGLDLPTTPPPPRPSTGPRPHLGPPQPSAAVKLHYMLKDISCWKKAYSQIPETRAT